MVWRWRGNDRPPWAELPKEGQESVWDFPRPPRVEKVSQFVRIVFAGEEIINTPHAVRVCETASPPTYYVPQSEIDASVLLPGSGGSMCEWKGRARYWSLRVGDQVSPNAGWDYPNIFDEFSALTGTIAFYPSRVDECWVGDDRVVPQPGDFYGGWVLPNLAGPWKGAPGSGGW